MSKNYSEVRPYFPTPRHMHGLFRNGDKTPEYMTYIGKNKVIYLLDSSGKTLETHGLNGNNDLVNQSLEIISKRM